MKLKMHTKQQITALLFIAFCVFAFLSGTAAAGGTGNIVKDSTISGPASSTYSTFHADFTDAGFGAATEGIIDITTSPTYNRFAGTVSVSADGRIAEFQNGLTAVSQGSNLTLSQGVHGSKISSGLVVTIDTGDGLSETMYPGETSRKHAYATNGGKTLTGTAKVYGGFISPVTVGTGLVTISGEITNTAQNTTISGPGTRSAGFGSGFSAPSFVADTSQNVDAASAAAVYNKFSGEITAPEEIDTNVAELTNTIAIENLIQGSNLGFSGTASGVTVTLNTGDGLSETWYNTTGARNHAYAKVATYLLTANVTLQGGFTSSFVLSAPSSITVTDVEDNFVNAVTVTALTGGTAAAGNAVSGTYITETLTTDTTADTVENASDLVYVTGDSAKYDEDGLLRYIYTVKNPRGAVLLNKTVSGIEKIVSGAIIDKDEASKITADLDTFVWTTDASGLKLQFTSGKASASPKTLTLKNPLGEKTFSIFTVSMKIVKGSTFSVDSDHIGKDIGTPNPNTIHLVDAGNGIATAVADGKLRVTVPSNYAADTLSISVDGDVIELALEEAEEAVGSGITADGAWEDPAIGDALIYAWNLSGKAVFAQPPSKEVYTYNTAAAKSGISYGISLNDVTVTSNGIQLVRNTDYEITGAGEIKLISQPKDNTYTYSVIGKHFGDADGDGTIDADDASRICYYLVGDVEIDEADEIYCDVNIDGRIRLTDARAIALYTVGL